MMTRVYGASAGIEISEFSLGTDYDFYLIDMFYRKRLEKDYIFGFSVLKIRLESQKSHRTRTPTFDVNLQSRRKLKHNSNTEYIKLT